jgi:RNA polymerase sigma-70 factor, ECF subfamily
VIKNNNQEDIILIRRARSGDQSAFTEIVNKYQSVVAATVIGMLGKNEDAEDVGQDVFIRFYHALDDYRGEASLTTYLTKIAINLSINKLKKNQRKNLIFSGFSKDEDGKEMDFADGQNLENRFLSSELVNFALQKLEPKFRAVVVLRMIQGYTANETSKILKLPLGTVLSRLSRAQDKLKLLLNQLLE